MTNGARLMLSTPPATNRSPCPHATAREASTTAASPLAQSRFTVMPATSTGRPPSSPARRATLRQSSPAWFVQPAMDVLEPLRREWAALDQCADQVAEEIVWTDGRERTRVAAERCPEAVVDERVDHRVIIGSVAPATSDASERTILFTVSHSILLP